MTDNKQETIKPPMWLRMAQVAEALQVTPEEVIKGVREGRYNDESLSKHNLTCAEIIAWDDTH